MLPERYWIAIVPEETYARERLYANDALVISDPQASPAGRAAHVPEAGEPVALVAATEPPLLFGLGRVASPASTEAGDAGEATISYTHRLFDDPVPLADERIDRSTGLPRLRPLARAEFEWLVAQVGGGHRVDVDRTRWLVSVSLPIEAASAAEAVREFWTYVDRLGPKELPAYVWPRADELAMQAYVLGDLANLDPEEDD